MVEEQLRRLTDPLASFVKVVLGSSKSAILLEFAFC